MTRLTVVLLVAVVLAGLWRLGERDLALRAQTAPPATTTFLETFDGAPGSPTPFRSPRWDVAVHGRDNRDQLRPFPHAGHGSDCAPPPASHDKGTGFEGTVFQCRDHVMTALHGDGYAVAYLTPAALVDFSQGETVIRWDMSTARTSERDWVDVWISPYHDNLQLPLNPGFPDLQGPPRRAIQVLLTTENALCPAVWVDGQEVEDPVAPYRCQVVSWTDIPGFPGPSATRRDTFEVRVSRTHLRVCLPAYGFCWYDRDLRQPLDWNQGIVQFGQHSYSPEKGTRYGNPTGPNTWHWDNVSISPALPFMMIRADRRFVDAGAPEVALDAPTPPGAHLRFSAWGTSIQTSTNGGLSWQPAQRAVQDNDCCHIFNYWTPIAAGATSVRFRADPWPGGAWQAKDISVWALTEPGAPTPAPVATSTATATPLPAIPTMAPTATEAATATLTPTIAATATVAPQDTPTPPVASPTPLPPLATVTATATATAWPACVVYVRRDGGPPEWVDCAIVRGGGP